MEETKISNMRLVMGSIALTLFLRLRAALPAVYLPPMTDPQDYNLFALEIENHSILPDPKTICT